MTSKNGAKFSEIDSSAENELGSFPVSPGGSELEHPIVSTDRCLTIRMVSPASAPENSVYDSELEKTDNIRNLNAIKTDSQVLLLENTEDTPLTVDQLPILSDTDEEHTVSNKEKAKNESCQPIQKGAASPHNRKHKQAKSSKKKNISNFTRLVMSTFYLALIYTYART